MAVLDLGFIGLLVLGSYLLLHELITIHVLLLFLVIGYKFFEPLISFGGFFSEMHILDIAADRITKVMQTPPLERAGTSLHT